MRQSRHAFTLPEMLVSITVLAFIVLFVTRLVNSAAMIATLGGKHMDADAQVRPLFDRMATDLSQIVKRNDVEYNLKFSSAPAPWTSNLMNTGDHNDRMTFFSTVPGDVPSTGSPSPLSLIAYRVCSSTAANNLAFYTRLQRFARGMLWGKMFNGTNSAVADGPMPFGAISTTAANGGISTIWASAVSSTTNDVRYELTGPQVFRFEYYYLLTNGSLSVEPWIPANGYTTTSVPACSAPPFGGLRDVAAIVVAVATIDPKSRVLLTNTQIGALAASLADYTAGTAPGQLLATWQTALNNNAANLPRPTVSAIRLYERYFYLPPTSF